VAASLEKALPAKRPLRAAQEFELQTQFRAALAAGDGVTGAHCIHEWWMRNAFPSRVEAALTRLWQHAAKSIPEWLPMHYVSWLPLVYEVAARFQAARRGRRNIYLVRLDYSDRDAHLQGIYVGMTAYAPAQRFDQHRAGIRAASSVLKRGQELLIGPVLHLQRLAQADAVRIERDLAIALRDAGLLVKGGH
jgi:predicted GIY-YIG superfamily endonuclease